MDEDARARRQRQIEDAAEAALVEGGSGGATMQAIARRAGASMETLYAWYGGKAGLLRTLVTRNAAEVRATLEAAADPGQDARAILRELGPKLLALLTGEKVVALNRAAAADPDGTLGRIIAEAGRETVAPLIAALFARLDREGALRVADPADAAETYLGLLVGDLQVRRIVGRMPPPDEAALRRRADKARRLTERLYAPG